MTSTVLLRLFSFDSLFEASDHLCGRHILVALGKDAAPRPLRLDAVPMKLIDPPILLDQLVMMPANVFDDGVELGRGRLGIAMWTKSKS